LDITVECNTSDDVLLANIRANSKLQIPWVKELDPHDGHAVICGSGPSLKDTLETIRWRKSLGQTIFALNGASRFLAENGIEVDHQIIVDARPENRRFMGWANHYYISSQCDSSLFFSSPDVTLWQGVLPGITDRYETPPEFEYTEIGGGTTVGLSYA